MILVCVERGASGPRMGVQAEGRESDILTPSLEFSMPMGRRYHLGSLPGGSRSDNFLPSPMSTVAITSRVSEFRGN